MGKKGKKGDHRAKHDEAADATGRSSAREARDAHAPVDAAQLATRLNTTALHLMRRLHREDAAMGLSSARLSALSVLVLGGPRTLGSLAATEGVTPPSMTRLMTAMETDGLVERTESASDGRLVILRATPAGQELLDRGRDGRVTALASLVAGLPAADQSTLEHATGILESMLRPIRPA